MRFVKDFPRRIADHPDVGIMMPDGTRLSARLWLPEDAPKYPVPAVLEYIPYRKRDGTLPRDELMHPYVAGHGYACLRVDMRGTGDSEGLLEDEYTQQELEDTCAVIAWAADQAWCSGSVGMMGKSWGGFNCLQTAAMRPPALKAVISVCSTTDRFADDIHFKGGCLLGENFGWGSVMLFYSSRPPDPALRPDWREEWLRRLDAIPFLAPRWAGHQARDEYWKHGSVCEDWSAIRVPILIVGGWADNYMNTCAHLLAHQQSPVKAIVGPWVHQYPHTAVPGPQIGFLQEAVRWWDRWLKGVPNGAEDDPALRAYILHSAPPDARAAYRSGHWVALQDREFETGTRQILPLSPGGMLGGEGGPLHLAVQTPQTLGMQAGEFFPMGLNAEMPGDQAEDDERSICFDTVPLEKDLTILGMARLSLRLSCDKPHGFVVARLCDVAPDGSSVRIGHGMLNLCHRGSMEKPSSAPAGECFDAGLDIDFSGYQLAAGHRLRLALSTTYWPFLWPSAEVATVVIEEGQLLLPLLPDQVLDWVPPLPEAAAPWAHRIIREGRSARRIEHDLIAGTSALVVEEDSGEAENLTHGLITGEKMAERWEIAPGDPLSARVEISWDQSLRRGGWVVRTRAETLMSARADALVMKARLRAWEGEMQVFERVWEEEVARVNV